MVRYKRRYLMVEISFQDKKVGESINENSIYAKVKEAVQEFHGDYGVACLARYLKVKYVNPITGMVFIGCSRDYYRMLWSAITFIRNLSGRLCTFQVLHVGGTLRSCQRFLIRHNRNKLLQSFQQCKTKGERRRVKKSIRKAETFEIQLDPFQTKQRKTNYGGGSMHKTPETPAVAKRF
ncbi:ribonuclease P/MRP protein subunit POP5-like [Acropora millepora]|uniref:ribonuclease P/MRP protein subunit POP5-like n=1 Tax=Acropora millepora TaxID=45264 RepID=UPI001CF4A63B|nr:ribonuclease P/MRP protein subunit POP5-like [Acropora millepora]